jgi:hypothetical protein
VRAVTPQRNYPKIFGLIGAGLGLVYMVYTVLAPYHHGPPVPMLYPLPPEDPAALAKAAGQAQPLSGLIAKLIIFGVLGAVFGMLVGTGVGVLVTGLTRKR